MENMCGYVMFFGQRWIIDYFTLYKADNVIKCLNSWVQDYRNKALFETLINTAKDFIFDLVMRDIRKYSAINGDFAKQSKLFIGRMENKYMIESFAFAIAIINLSNLTLDDDNNGIMFFIHNIIVSQGLHALDSALNVAKAKLTHYQLHIKYINLLKILILSCTATKTTKHGQEELFLSRVAEFQELFEPVTSCHTKTELKSCVQYINNNKSCHIFM